MTTRSTPPFPHNDPSRRPPPPTLSGRQLTVSALIRSVLFLLPCLHPRSSLAQTTYLESGGLVVIEAEHFASKSIVSGRTWELISSAPLGASQAGSMQSLPNTGITISTSIATTSPVLAFWIQFTTPGTYNYWIRAWGASGSDDSVFLGVNGTPGTSSVSFGATGSWVWKSRSVTIPASGTHQVGIWMREDGAYIDRILLTTNLTFTPTGVGPTESAIASGPAPNTPPQVQLTSPSNGATLDAGVPTLLSASASDPGGSVFQVAFLSNGIPVATVSTPPYQVMWTPPPGSISLSAIATDDLGLTATNAITVSAISAGSSGPFLASAGQVVIEAENFASKSATTHAWEPRTTPTGFVGTAAMQASPNSGVTISANIAAASPSLTFKAQFAAAGSYNFWIRGRGATGSDDSLYVGINQVPNTSSLTVSPTGSWVWKSRTVTIPSAGIHDLNVWMREDGVLLDRILLTTNLTFTPSGNGPAESLRSLPSNAAPDIQLVLPLNGTHTMIGTTLILASNPSDPDGTVASVRYFIDGILLGSPVGTPFTSTWTPSVPGTYLVTALATDDGADSALSNSATVTVSDPPNQPPAITLTAPLDGTNVVTGTTLSLDVTVSDPDGTVTAVRYFVDGTLLGSPVSSPFTSTWTPSVPGTYVVTALATDDDGADSALSNSATVTVSDPPNQPPTITLTAPLEGTNVVTGTTLSLEATVSDPDGTVTAVRYFVDGILLGSPVGSPFTSTWTPSVPGTYLVTALATDDDDADSALSNSATVTVSDPPNQPPTITLTAPLEGTNVITGTTLSLDVTASDPDGTVTAVRYFVDGTLLGSPVSSPFTSTWTPSVPGTYVVTALATDDDGADSALSNSATVTVLDPPNQPPTITLTAPLEGTNVVTGTTLSLEATVSDPDGTVTAVRYFVDGILLGSPVGSPFTSTWTPSVPGTYLVTALATDDDGADSALSNSATVTVSDPPNQPPNITLTVPLDGTNVITGTTLSLIVAVSDPDGTVTAVRYFVDGILLGPPVGSPFTSTWTPSVPGTYVVTALATDDDGADSALSNSATVTVSDPPNQPPAITLTAPLDGTNVVTGTTLSLDVTVSDPDGTVTAVRYFVDGILLGSPVGSPFTSTWTPSVPGTYVVTALATDDDGADSALSNSATVTVSNPPNQPPSISLTAPIPGTNIVVGTHLFLAADATDPDGTILEVIFLADGNPFATVTEWPYEFEWTPAEGIYSVSAIATDNDGASTASTDTQVTVSPPSNEIPTVLLTAPPDDSIFDAGDVISMHAVANDPDGSVVQVTFFANSVELGVDLEAPYEFDWQAITPGAFEITAVATDNQGATGASVPSLVIVTPPPNLPPTVALTSPVSGTSIPSGNAVLLSADAQDGDGTVTQVRFTANGQEIGIDMTIPYSISWMPNPGVYTLVAEALDDDLETSLSDAVSFTATPGVNMPPTVQITSPGNRTSFPVGTPIAVNVTAADVDGAVTQVQLYANGNVVGTRTSAPFAFSWDPSAGTYVVVAVATDNLGATTTSTVVLVRATSPALTVAGTRWANTSNRMYFELGGVGCLSDIKFVSSTAPLDIVDPVNMIWLARANIFITNSTLRLHGTAIGGDVNELRLQSNDAAAASNVVSVIADYGTISIHTTKITSWNTIHGGPDTEYDTYGRAFLRARSRLAVEGNPASAPLESRMDIINSDIGYLGAHIAESYGITLKVLGNHSVITNLFELVQVRGDILDSKIHHNYFGVYTYGAQDCHWARNEVYSNVQYGLDPHDDSDFLIIKDNEVHHNGNHGIIASRRCDNLIIRNNRSYANRLNGIMLHRHCAFSLISSNLVYQNGDSGIAIFDTDKTLIIGNTVLSNANAGIRFSMGSADNRIEANVVGHSGEYGFYFFQGSDPAEPDPYDPTVSNRNRRNLFVNNLVYDTVLDPIKMTDGDTNSFIGNVFTNNGNTFRFTNSRGNHLASNSIPDTALFALNGTASLPSIVSFEGQNRIKLDLPGAYGGGTFTDDEGSIFDFDESALSTSVDPSGSFVSLTSVTVGAGTTVVRRNLRVTLPEGVIGVNTTEWGTTAPFAKKWTTSSTTGTEVVTYHVGDLLPGASYSVFRNNLPLLSGLVADASGSIEFTHTTGSTLPAVYLVSP